MHWKWVVLWSLWAARLVRQPTKPLRIAGGWLSGSVAPDGSHVYYLGIPYATVDERHRFKAPGPEPNWEGVYEAVDENIRCHQRVGDFSILTGQTNCLALNVYTPLNVLPNQHLPVMVFIHGGGFFQGSGSRFLYGPKYLVTKGVILVSINYRLNLQGYLCLRTKEAPGNAGMKDQVAALKWVQRNIRAFGGDPDNVTIFGESAGGASVSYHVLSPMSKGLFHRAIMQSGSALTAWAFQFRPVYMASLLAKAMGHDEKDPHELYDLFMNKTDEDIIITRVPRKEGNVIVSEVLYVPCAEELIEGEEPFITDTPFNILKSGDYNKVPTLLGVNNEEGYLFLAVENQTMIPKIRFEKSLPKDLVIKSKIERERIAAVLKSMYMGDDDIFEETKLKLSKFHGELYFQYPTLEETELLLISNDKPVYSYVLSYDGWRNIPKLTLGKPYSWAPGATHADDLFYLFEVIVIPSMFESKMIDRMTTLWTNFAKYSDPTPPAMELSELVPIRWQPTQQTAPQALVIDAQLHTQPLWFSDTLLYWRELYAKYRRTGD